MRSTVTTLGLLLVLATGCSASTGPSAVSADKLEKEVSAALTKQVGQKPDDISCPKNLPAKKGATVRCTLTAGSDRLGVTVRTTSVSDDGQVRFGVQVDRQPSS